MKRIFKIIIFLVYLVFGIYFINSFLNFFEISEFFANFSKWINLIGGILILIGGINYLRAGRERY